MLHASRVVAGSEHVVENDVGAPRDGHGRDHLERVGRSQQWLHRFEVSKCFDKLAGSLPYRLLVRMVGRSTISTRFTSKG